ncbi:MAG TPA: hypothetical protein VNO52_09495 [Methylomirabilota bacterium]|nr:hypothetical protein [Methylomirabilota bacterium]
MEGLKNEFEAGEDSVLIKLRPRLEWGKVAFNRLTSARKRCAETTSSDRMLERWVAEGFWFVSRDVRSWAAHPNFPRVQPTEYCNQAPTRLDDLAFWHFTGQSRCRNGTGFEELA